MIKEIQATLKKNASTKAKEAAGKFVPGSQKVYGVRLPVINRLAQEYKQGGFPLVEKLWHSGMYEERLLAAKLLGKVAKKDPVKTLMLVNRFSKALHDWAVCDTLATQSVRPISASHSKEIFALSSRLIISANPWQRRLAIVLIEWYTRDKAFHSQIKHILDQVKNDREYYVKKAVTWINRNFKKKQ